MFCFHNFLFVLVLELLVLESIPLFGFPGDNLEQRFECAHLTPDERFNPQVAGIAVKQCNVSQTSCKTSSTPAVMTNLLYD
jgi:hypothetical protein